MNELLTEGAGTVGAIAAIILGVGVIWIKGLKPMGRIVRHAIHWGKRIASQLVWFDAQLSSNGGSTVKDQITRIEKQVQKVENNAEAHWQALENGTAAIAERVTNHHTELTTRLSLIEKQLQPTGLPVQVSIQQDEPVDVHIVTGETK